VNAAPHGDDGRMLRGFCARRTETVLTDDDKHALRHVLALATSAAGTLVPDFLTPPSSVFILRSGGLDTLRTFLDRLGRLPARPAIVVVGRPGDQETLSRIWTGPISVHTCADADDFSPAGVQSLPDVVSASRGCSHHVFLARNISGSGYDNVFGVFAALGVDECYGATLDGRLCLFRTDAQGLRRASTELGDSLMKWVVEASQP
jgi:hypothetical protein